MKYAQIDADGICISVIETDGAISAPDVIELTDAAANPIGQKWDGSAWVSAPKQSQRIIPRQEFTGCA